MSDVSRRFCRGTRKDGKPCQAPPTASGFCYFHENPDQVRILGRKGGRKNGYPVTDITVPDHATAAALGGVLDQTLRELLAGRLDARVATAVAQVVNTRRRLSDTIDHEARIAELEKKLADTGPPAVSENAEP